MNKPGFRAGMATAMVALACFVAIPAFADMPRLAVLTLDQSPETRTLADLLAAELQKDAELLERAELDRVLAEQQLSAAGLAGGQADRVAVGKLLRADGFLLVGTIASVRRLSARLVETRYGFQVSQVLCPTNTQDLAARASHIAPALAGKLPLLRAPDDQRILVGVLRAGLTHFVRLNGQTRVTPGD